MNGYRRNASIHLDEESKSASSQMNKGELNASTHLELVQYYRCSPGDLGIQPCYVAGVHIDTTMTPVAIKRSGAARVIMWKIVSWPKISPPPGIVEEVASGMVFHCIFDGRWR